MPHILLFDLAHPRLQEAGFGFFRRSILCLLEMVMEILQHGFYCIFPTAIRRNARVRNGILQQPVRPDLQ